MAQAWFETLLRYDGLDAMRAANHVMQQAAEKTPRSAKITVLRDLEYIPGGHERQKLDLYLPNESHATDGLRRLRPLVLWVHGGAWRAGSKERCPAQFLLQEGYAVASINYRLSQHAVFPAQIEDCKAAIRWLREHAADHGLDASHFGVWGSSAGGHLAALVGTTGSIKEFDVGRNTSVSSRVQAACDFFGPTDFAKMTNFPSRMNHDAPDSPESRLIGGPIQDNKAKTRRANPIAYVTRDAPPFLIVHGDQDPLVPHNQSDILYKALRDIGVEVTFYTIRGGGHGGFRNATVHPLVTKFFNKHLKQE